jgi:hypothetical protein
MADVSLARVDEHGVTAVFGAETMMKPGSSGGAVDSKESAMDDLLDEDFSLGVELRSAVDLCLQALDALTVLVDAELQGGWEGGQNKSDEVVNSPPSEIAAASMSSHEQSVLMQRSSVLEVEEQEACTSSKSAGDGEWAVGGEEVLESLGTQCAGLLHKLVTATSLLVSESLRCACITEGLDCVRRLLPPLRMWSRLRAAIHHLTSVQNPELGRAQQGVHCIHEFF